MAWSIFEQGGGQGAAATWADDLLGKLGAPTSPGNEQFIYDWEVSEGGGGAYNPLNQGPVPGHPELTTTGSQYGGGAADFAGWNAGLTGAVDYLNMPAYAEIKASLLNNDPAGARSALIQSPWAASHYGDGASFSDAPLPGKKSTLPPDGGKSGDPSSGKSSTDILPTWLNDITSLFGFNINADAASGKDFVERAGLIIFGFILLIVGIIVLFRGPERARMILENPTPGGIAQAMPGGKSNSGRAVQAAASLRKKNRSKSKSKSKSVKSSGTKALPAGKSAGGPKSIGSNSGGTGPVGEPVAADAAMLA